jgi:hypothetical protein
MPQCKTSKFYRPSPWSWKPPARPRPRAPRSALVFDACHVGVVLRAVLFVEIVLGVGAMFGASTLLEWLARVALLTGGAPARHAGLADCRVQPQDPAAAPGTNGQYAAGVVLGALAGLYACGMLALVGVAEQPPWLASAASGALLAAMLVAALVMRASGRTPAATTARLTELQSRIRPHFLFNTLNSAIALVREEPAKAESLLEDLSDLFRHALVEQGEAVTLAKRSRWRAATWPSKRCALASACRCNGRWTRAPAAPACRRCCCSRWWKTPSSTAWSPAPPARRSASARSAGAAGGDQGHQHGARRPGPSRATGWRWTTCATACACCTTCSRNSRPR